MYALEKRLEFLVELVSNTARKLELSNLAKFELHRLSMDSKEREQYNMKEKDIYNRISFLENTETKENLKDD
uniref:Uncharacterized protein n=1 Tax=Clostridium perfringens TaxID=1502 RepID=A0A4Y5T4A3_CLOPF|nr:hypothetical protein [Clostridium perfringens]